MSSRASSGRDSRELPAGEESVARNMTMVELSSRDTSATTTTTTTTKTQITSTSSMTSMTTTSSHRSEGEQYWDVNEEFDLKKAVEFYLKAKEANKELKEELPSLSVSQRPEVSALERNTLSNRAATLRGDPLATSSDLQNVSKMDLTFTQTFKNHAWGNGMLLHFNKKSIELAFMNEYSVLHKKDLVLGYVMGVALGAILVGLDNVFYDYERKLCTRDGNGGALDSMEDVSEIFYCDILFGPLRSDRRNVFNFSYLFSMVFLNVVGLIVHFLIHQRARVQNKAWSLLSANAVYMTEIILLIVLMVNLHSGDNFWPLKLMMWYMLLIMVSMWLTGFLFVQNLAIFVISLCVYFPMTYKVATQKELNSGNTVISELDSLLTVSLYGTTSHFITFIHVAMLASSYMNERASRKRFFQRLMITYQQDKIIHEKSKHGKLQKKLLFNMLPKTIVDQLEIQGYQTGSWDQLKGISQRHQGVCILFADIPQFADFARKADCASLMCFLNDVFESFDCLCDIYDVYKVETVADSYVAAVGIVTGSILNNLHKELSLQDLTVSSVSLRTANEELIEAAGDNTKSMVGFGKAILSAAQRVRQPILGTPTQVRIGIHTGACMSGIVGTKNLRFCLFGDTMNTAARMMQNGQPAVIQASEIVSKLTPNEKWESKGKVEMKGKGCVETYRLRG